MSAGGWKFPRNRYRCPVVVVPEDGGFSVYAATLPGAVSQGDTFDDALKNITEALQGVLASYLEDGERIPWGEFDTESVPPGGKLRVVAVDVPETGNADTTQA